MLNAHVQVGTCQLQLCDKQWTSLDLARNARDCSLLQLTKGRVKHEHLAEPHRNWQNQVSHKYVQGLLRLIQDYSPEENVFLLKAGDAAPDFKGESCAGHHAVSGFVGDANVQHAS